MNARHFDVIVIGGGLVGAAIAFGLRDLGGKLAVLDEGDIAYRAARGNFGLIWVQGKGLGLAPYGAWTQRSARAWPRLAALLRDETGIDVALRQQGGVHVCLSQRELDARSERFAQLFAQPGFERYAVETLGRAELAKRLPGLGPEVVGGTWSALDGDCNPLRLLRALDAGLERAGVVRLSRDGVAAIEPRAGSFGVRTVRAQFTCERVVLAAGLGNARLAPMVGIAAAVAPNKGQIMVLERAQRFLSVPIESIRQTDDGTVLLGDSQQERGFDDAVDPAVLAAIAARAVRAWAALRVMSPDGFPIYAQSRAYPGAFVATCHSGVTLAAAHAFDLAPAIRSGALGAEHLPFAVERFDVRAVA